MSVRDQSSELQDLQRQLQQQKEQIEKLQAAQKSGGDQTKELPELPASAKEVEQDHMKLVNSLDPEWTEQPKDEKVSDLYQNTADWAKKK